MVVPSVSRALKFTLLIGTQVSLLLALIYASDALRPLDASIAQAFGWSGALVVHGVVQFLTFIALAYGVTWTTIDIRRPAFKAAVAAGVFAEAWSLSAVLALYGVYFSPVLPSAAALLAFIGAMIYLHSEGGKRQQAVDAAFGARVSQRQSRALVEGRMPLDAEGQAQELTVAVCEIFNHQQLMESLDPAQYVALSNRFLNCAAATLVERGGCLMACDGEGVRVIFGAPLPQPNHASAACRAALEVARQIKTLNEETARERDGLTCDLRIGVNSGEMAAGRFGSPGLGGFGVAGEEVAFARRLCAANLIYGSTILIGARTYSLAEAMVEARPLELLRRRVGEHWLEVYELLGEPSDLSAEDIARRDLFWTGVIFYREKRLADALEKFSQVRAAIQGPDGPLDFYLHRIKQLQQSKSATDWETGRLLNSL
jgi:class 3 adenylate cyclase